MDDIIIVVDSKTGFASSLNNDMIHQENLQRKIIYQFKDDFVDGQAYLCIEKDDGTTGYIAMTKNEEQYELDIYNSLISDTKLLKMNIRIVQSVDDTVPIFVSTVSRIRVVDTIEAEVPIDVEYPTWQDIVDAKLLELEAGINTNAGNIAQNASDIDDIKAEQLTQNANISNNTARIIVLEVDSGNKVALSIDSNYVMTLKLLNKNNVVLSTASIDFPIENMIVNATYSNGIITLILQNGNTLNINISDIIDGLVSQTDFDALELRVDTAEIDIDTLQGQVETLENQVEELEEKVEDLENLIPTSTAEGEYITLEDSARYEFKEFEVSGKTEQESTTGKNKLNLEDGTLTSYGVTITIVNGKVTIKGTTTANYVWVKLTNGIATRTGTPTSTNSPAWFTNSLLSGEKYAFSKIGTCDKSLIYTKVGDSGTTTLIDSTNTSSIIDLSENTLSDIAMYLGGVGSVIDIEFYLQTVEGETPDYTYEPYTNGVSPNPSYLQDIKNTGDNGSVNIVVQNKNKFVVEDIEEGVYYDNNGRNTLASGAAFAQVYAVSEGDKLVFSVANNYTATIRDYLFMYDKNMNYVKADDWGVSISSNDTRVRQITISENVKFFAISILGLPANLNIEDYLKIQLENGETKTGYIKGEQQTITFPLSEGQVLHEGDYLADDGVHQVRKTIEVSGNDIIRVANIDKDRYPFNIRRNDMKKYSLAQTAKHIKCNYFIAKFSSEDTSNDKDIATIRQGQATNDIWFFVPKKYFEGTTSSEILAEFKNIVDEWSENEKPMRCEYDLNEEITVEYTSEQQEAYNQIKELYSYKGITHIFSTDETSPVFNAEYRQDPSIEHSNLQSQIDALEARIALLE